MKIELTISTDTLGDINTTTDNQLYIAAVQKHIEAAYPDADVRVDLTESFSADLLYVSDDEDDHIREHVRKIANEVWDREEY